MTKFKYKNDKVDWEVFKLKKGELSINVIVVAAISMIVLVILSVLVFQSGADLRTTTSDCQSLESGVCIDDSYSCSEEGDFRGENLVSHPGAECPQGQRCCLRQ